MPFALDQTASGQFKIADSQTPGSQLTPGDLLITCDGYAIHSLNSLELLIDGKKNGDEVTLRFLHDDFEYATIAILRPHYSLRYFLITIPFGLLFLALGLFVNLKRPDKPEARIFYYNLLAIAIMYFFPWRSYNLGLPGVAQFLQFIYLSAYAATPIFFLKFAGIYPREKKFPPQTLSRLLSGLYITAVPWLTIAYSIATIRLSFEWYDRFTFWFNIFRVLFSAGLLFALAQFVHSYFSAPEEEDRRRLRWILLGLAIGAFAIIFLWTVPQIVLSHGLLPEEFVLLICAVVPISFAISIVRHHLLDIDIIFNRSVVYAIIFLIIATIYTLVIGALAYFVSTFTVELSVASSAIVAAIIAIFFEPLRQKIQTLVDKTFFRVRYNYREAVLQINEKLSHCLAVSDTGKILLQHIEKNILPEFSGFYEYKTEGKTCELVFSSHLPPTLKNTELWHTPTVVEKPILANFNFLEQRADYAEWALKLTSAQSPALLFFLADENKKPQAVLLLGPKKSGFRYSLEDIDLLRACVHQTAETIGRLRLQQKLICEQELAQSLAELSKTKSQFISSVTHELKTPLTAIKMFAEMLQNKTISKQKIKEYATIIDGEADRLNRLIGTVLDFAKIERGSKTFQFQSLDLNKIINKALRPFAYIFKMEAFEVQIDLSPHSLPVTADPDSLIRIINNLVNNAMKYSGDAKKIAVASSQQNGYAILAVSDQGIGIAANEHQNIFEPFYRAPDECVRRIGGAGLGLQVVKTIAEAHKGHIKVESQPGKGSIFTVFLPMEKQDETPIDHRR